MRWVGAIHRKRAEKRESEFESMKPWREGETLADWRLRTGRWSMPEADAAAFDEYQESLARQMPDESDTAFKTRTGLEVDPAARPIPAAPKNEKIGSLERRLRTGLLK